MIELVRITKNEGKEDESIDHEYNDSINDLAIWLENLCDKGDSIKFELIEVDDEEHIKLMD